MGREIGCFEVKTTDLLGRVGRLYTKSGVVETPALLPVVHPVEQELPIDLIKKTGFKAVMTNAYIALKRLGEEAVRRGIHATIGFEGVVMTDSGGYQVLEYGGVDITPKDMVVFEEGIGADIAVVLDRPTGLGGSRSFAEQTVIDTLKACEETVSQRSREDILWAGPIQGGRFTDLVKMSATRTAALPFDLHALGSPTEVMKTYDFKSLLKMIVAAKISLPIDRPLHLFGAGHPLTIPLATALGCDLYDSASYILYAKDDRYMTPYATLRLEELSELACTCPVCTQHAPEELKEAEREERIRLLAAHNLYTLQQEVKQTRQAILDGRLWDLVALKARSHPKAWSTFVEFTRLTKILEDGTPVFKDRAVYLYLEEDLRRPEVYRHRERLRKDFKMVDEGFLILVSLQCDKRLLSTPFCRRIMREAKEHYQILFVSPVYILIPVEVSEIYPLSQTLYSSSLAKAFRAKTLCRELEKIVRRGRYRRLIAVCLNPEMHSRIVYVAHKLNFEMLDYCMAGVAGQVNAAEVVLKLMQSNA